MVKKENGQVRSKVPFVFLFHGNFEYLVGHGSSFNEKTRKRVILTVAKLNVLFAIRRKINQTDQPRHRPCLSACRGGVGAPAAQETDRRRHDTEVICAFRCASQPSAVQQR
jgi:hypothetical protein